MTPRPLSIVERNPSRAITEQGDLVLAIVGSGGDGVITAGELLASSAASEGLYCMVTKSYGPQIRGGESSVRVRFASHPVQAPGDKLDVLVIFDWRDFALFKDEYILREGAIVVVAQEKDLEVENWPITPPPLSAILHIPLEELAKKTAGLSLARNVVLMGLLAEMFNLPVEGVKSALTKKFAKKPTNVLEGNLLALEGGAEYAKGLEFTPNVTIDREDVEAGERVIMTGNEAFGFGAVYAGCDFYAGYPISPASEVMEYMASELPRFGGTSMQTEDEISAVAMCVGASYGGAKAMTATSGPGFSLMQEAIGLASIAEIPLVVMNVMRGGPSTGLPTATEQTDLMQSLWGSHGDSPRVVLAPADVEDCFDLGVEAFYISEKYQIPVIVLLDQFVAQRKEAISADGIIDRNHGFITRVQRKIPTPEELIGGDVKRFNLDTLDGVSHMPLPGMEGGIYTLSGLEHDEFGNPSVTSTKNHELQTKKRYKKFKHIVHDHELQFLREYGDKDAKVGVVCWGSTKGAAKLALMHTRHDGHKVKMICPQMLNPLPRKRMKQLLEGLDDILLVDMTHTKQFYRHLLGHLDTDLMPRVHHVNRPGGLPWRIEEIEKPLRTLLAEVGE